MRRPDLILPALLAVAVTVMAVYASSGNDDSQQIATAGLACEAEPLGQLGELRESSGLAASRRNPDLVWSHNDSGSPLVYGVRTDGSLAGRVRVSGAAVIDWEAITVGACDGTDCLYVGDIGDNDRKRGAITIYRTREPLPGDAATARAEAIEASYPEGPQDAEALFLANGTLFIVTKGEGTPIRVYRLPALAPGVPQTLELVASLTDAGTRKVERVTDAAASPGGRWIALRTNDAVLFYPAAELTSGRPATALAHDLRGLGEPQGEGITWTDDRTLYLSGEAAQGGTFNRISCTLP